MPPPWTSFFCSVYPDGDPYQWVHVAITTVPLRWVGAVLLNIAGVPRASAVSGLFPTPPLGWVKRSGQRHAVGYSSLSSCMLWRASAPRWETGWSGRPLHPFSPRSLPCTGQRPVLGIHHLVPLVSLSGPRLLCNIVRACVPSQVAFAVLYSLSFGTGTARFRIGTPKAFSTRFSALGGGVCDPLHRFLFTRDLAQQVSSLFLTSRMQV